MSKLYPSIDPEGLVEYSVVYSDRSLNHMSQTFQGVMKNISSTLKQVYNAQAVAVSTLVARLPTLRPLWTKCWRR